jgi:hypothetical protein
MPPFSVLRDYSQEYTQSVDVKRLTNGSVEPIPTDSAGWLGGMECSVARAAGTY